MTKQSKTLRQVLDADCCTGCGLCASAFGEDKLEMQITDPGYLRPTQIEGLSGDEEARFSELCPGIHLDQSSSEGQDHPIWGPVIKVRIGASTDKGLRQNGSSGGALSALLCYLLDRGDAEYVLQTAGSEVSPIENQTVESRNREQVLNSAGSRYSPASPLTNLAEKLDAGKPFVLVGKPCDIAATRAFSKHDKRVDETIPYLLSFFCAGVPSLYGTRQILSTLDVKEDDLISFRYRGDGWPGFATAVTKDGKTSRMSYADSWGDILSHHTQFRCKVCPDGSGGFADVACADAWDCDEKWLSNFRRERRTEPNRYSNRTRRRTHSKCDIKWLS